MERDEVYVPKTRSDLGIPKAAQHEIDWEEYFGDTPVYTLFMLIRQQLLAFPAYLSKLYFMRKSGVIQLTSCLVCNVSGQKSYPQWTNHFDRTCAIDSMTVLVPT